MDEQIIERAVEAAARADYEEFCSSTPGRREPWDERSNDVREGVRSYVRPLVTATLAVAESALTAERDALAARVARVEDERDRLKRGGHTLGKIIDRWGEAIIAATDSESLVDEDRDGDWQVIEERLAGLRPELIDLRARVARVEALADEYETLAYNCERASDCPICVTYQGVVIGMRRAIRGESE